MMTMLAPAQPARPQAPTPVFDNIPVELRERQQWVVWRYELEKEKWKKVPYAPGTTRKASTTSPATWGMFDEAVACYRARPDFFDGIGFVFSASDPYVGGDIDNCLAGGELNDFAREYLPHTYAEISPSGKGIKFIARGDGDYGRKVALGELYSKTRFFTITGRVLPGHAQIVECSNAVAKFAEALGASRAPRRASSAPGSGSRAAIAAAVPASDWAAARRIIRNPASVDLLLRRAGRSAGEGTQFGVLLAGDLAAFHRRWPGAGLLRDDGSLDESQMRYLLACGLRGRGFTRPEFFALVHLLCHHHARAADRARWREELATLWHKAPAAEYAPRRTGRRVVEPAKGKRARGRPAGAQIARLYRLFDFFAHLEVDEWGRILTTRAELGAELQVSERTIAGDLERLRQVGAIATMRSRRGLYIVVRTTTLDLDVQKNTPDSGDGDAPALPPAEPALLPVVAPDRDVQKNAPAGDLDVQKNTRPQQAVQPIVAPDSRSAEAAIEETHVLETTNCVSSIASRDEFSAHLQDDTPALADLAAAYLSQPPAQVGQRLVNKQTGELRYRRSAKHFAELVCREYGDRFTEAQARSAYQAERERQHALYLAEWQRYFDRLRAMTNDQLVAFVAGGLRAEVAELARKAGEAFDAHLYRKRRECALRELASRGLQLPAPARRQRGQAATPATPPTRPTAPPPPAPPAPAPAATPPAPERQQQVVISALRLAQQAARSHQSHQPATRPMRAAERSERAGLHQVRRCLAAGDVEGARGWAGQLKIPAVRAEAEALLRARWPDAAAA